MAQDLLLQCKWTLRASSSQFVLVKRLRERTTQVFVKTFIWAMYLPDCPELAAEIWVSDHYKIEVFDRFGGCCATANC